MLTEKQLRERKTGIGGSDVAAIFGMSKYKTPIDVYLDKTSDTVSFVEPTKQMKWGIEVEPVICNIFAKEYDKEVIQPTDTYRHPENSWMIANLDGWIESEKAVIEIKTASRGSEWGDEGSDNIPTEYLLQCAHYCAVMDASIVYIYVSIGGAFPKLYVYERDTSLEAKIIEKEQYFWETHILKNKPPKIQTNGDISKIYTGRDSKPLVSTEIEFDLEIIDALKKIEKDIKNLEHRKEQMKNLLCMTLKDHTVLVDEDYNELVTWKPVTTNRFDTKHFRKEHPDLYKQYLKKSQSRYFRVK